MNENLLIFEYFLTFIDDKSHCAWVYPLKTKDQVFDCFLEWKALVEKSKLFTLTIGKSTLQRHLKPTWNQKGYGMHTIPKTPGKNGVVEQLNWTLVESSRSILLDAKLPHKFWVEAISTAVNLRNCCQTKTVKDMTPYKAWHGEKPKVEHLRLFGCDAYAHIPKNEWGKLDWKARRCILLGYNQETEGYILYDPTRRKVLHSRNVKNQKESQNSPSSDADYTIWYLNFLVTMHLKSNWKSIFWQSCTWGSTQKINQGEISIMERSHLSETQNEPSSIEEATSCSEGTQWKLRWNLLKTTMSGSLWSYKLEGKVDGSKWV